MSAEAEGADPQLERCLRPMRAEDVAAVTALEARNYRYPWREQLFRDCLAAGYSCWVLELRLGLVGYALLSLVADEAHVLNLGVAPEQRRQHWGRRMMIRLFAIARAQGARVSYLEVRPSNRAACALYRSLGYLELGRRPAYYQSDEGREDALIMMRRLDAPHP